MPNESLKKLYVDELKDLYSAENQLVKALPKMAKAALSEYLRKGFEKHLEQTKGHVARLEVIFRSLEESPKGKKCMGIEGLIKGTRSHRGGLRRGGNGCGLDWGGAARGTLRDCGLRDRARICQDSGRAETCSVARRNSERRERDRRKVNSPSQRDQYTSN